MNAKYSQLKGGNDSINIICSDFVNDGKFLFATVIPIYSNFAFSLRICYITSYFYYNFVLFSVEYTFLSHRQCGVHDKYLPATVSEVVLKTTQISKAR
jgi:hypothetical protein